MNDMQQKASMALQLVGEARVLCQDDQLEAAHAVRRWLANIANGHFVVAPAQKPEAVSDAA